MALKNKKNFWLPQEKVEMTPLITWPIVGLSTSLAFKWNALARRQNGPWIRHSVPWMCHIVSRMCDVSWMRYDVARMCLGVPWMCHECVMICHGMICRVSAMSRGVSWIWQGMLTITMCHDVSRMSYFATWGWIYVPWMALNFIEDVTDAVTLNNC